MRGSARVGVLKVYKMVYEGIIEKVWSAREKGNAADKPQSQVR